MKCMFMVMNFDLRNVEKYLYTHELLCKKYDSMENIVMKYLT